MAYAIEFAKSTVKDLKKIPSSDQNKIVEAIQELAENPRPNNVKKLQGSDFYRIRIGDYRVIYDIQDTLKIILILKDRA